MALSVPAVPFYASASDLSIYQQQHHAKSDAGHQFQSCQSPTSMTMLAPHRLNQIGMMPFETGSALKDQRWLENLVQYQRLQQLVQTDAVSSVRSLHSIQTVADKLAVLDSELSPKQVQTIAQKGRVIAGMQHERYGTDAPWTIYRSDREVPTGNSFQIDQHRSTHNLNIAYGGLYMAGRAYHAVDIRDPDSPKMIFQIDPDREAVTFKNAAQSYPELRFMGQSWSKPSIVWIKWQGEKRLIMLVGGGYDAGGSKGDGLFQEDGSRAGYAGYEQSNYRQTNSIGAGMYMFDALTGELLWWVGANATAANSSAHVRYTTEPQMKYSVVSQIKTVDRNADGLTDHAYFGDLGGQIWRIDFNNHATAMANFVKPPTRLLNLSEGDYTPRFYDMPAFSIYREHGQVFAVLSIGSGNRSTPLFQSEHESPLLFHIQPDAIYNIYDKDVTAADLYAMDSAQSTRYRRALQSRDLVLADASSSTPQLNQLMALTAAPQSDTSRPTASFTKTAGWYLPFSPKLPQNEKVLGSPIVLNHDLYVMSYQPDHSTILNDCGEVVRGMSYMHRFCMPYGHCEATIANARPSSAMQNLGAGIVIPYVGSAKNGADDIRAVMMNGELIAQQKMYQTRLVLSQQRWYEWSY
ncbi:MAG: hypothetical protein QM666_03900 [Acinetobacter sp.]